MAESLPTVVLKQKDKIEWRCIHDAILKNKGLGLHFTDSTTQSSHNFEDIGTVKDRLCLSPIQFRLSKDFDLLATPVISLVNLLKYNKPCCQTRHVLTNKAFSVIDKDHLYFTSHDSY
jgi:hypothetical protein